MITLQNGLVLTKEDLSAIADKIRTLLPQAPSEDMTLEEAAKEMGVSCSTKQSLSSAFSRFGSDKHYKYPLRSNRVGAERFFKRADVLEFKRRGKDNKIKTKKENYERRHHSR